MRGLALCLMIAAGPALADAPWFTEQAQAVGLDFRHINGMSGQLWFVENVGGGVALFDYDNDGDLDVYLVQGALLDPRGDLDGAIFPPTPGMLPLRDRSANTSLALTRFSIGAPSSMTTPI